ncbi:hypothetical protein XPU_0744, partial [Xanthomonas arboricola pv. pruni str. MAFF 311562]
MTETMSWMRREACSICCMVPIAWCMVSPPLRAASDADGSELVGR